MTIKQIFVPITGIGEPIHVPALAFKIAKRFDANVEGCDTVTDQAPYLDPAGFGLTPSLYQELAATLDKATKERCANARRVFERARIKAGLTSQSRKGPRIAWTTTIDNDSSFLVNTGRLSDLSVVNLPGPEGHPADFQIMEQLVFRTGRPVLAVPENGANELTGRVAIAWNGSVEAARAISAAIPLMQHAKSVRIIQVGEPGGPDAGAVRRYLASHGIDCKILTPTDRKGGTGKIILEQVESENCGLLVMGAYTHSAARELVFGGVTNHVFQSSSVPVLLAH